ncbi:MULTISPECIES: RNA polymerase sigma factor [Bacteroidota]|uniref:RNA polymerase sigma factor n=1 Tax=Bacteroidota TaxID=976 RepID=UPI0008A45866|nr:MULTISPECIES: sigma-70 family RNA polymerase sigma factor [Bacteroidota]OFV13728.1 hypothetical protein HMPREF3127_14660 [Sphingobacterium sp. HMSC13C05]HAU56074.1 sigma-70 family RNA polymerase sigma factor [Sphingobacterium sp.]
MDNASSFVSLEDLRKESVLTLMEYMAMAEEEPAIANLAFNVFYEIVSPSFMVACVKACKPYQNLYDGLAEVIFNNALLNAYKKSAQFRTDHKDSDKALLAVKSWLFGIARNELYQELRTIEVNSRLSIVEDILVLESEVEYHENENSACFEKEILEQALNTLNEKERGVLLMCYQFSEDGKNIPSDVIERINKVFNITEPNRRQIKKRALDKLKKQVDYLLSKTKR